MSSAADRSSGSSGSSESSRSSRSSRFDGSIRTYQLYVGGVFAGSESGRTYPVTDYHGTVVAAVAQASRRDARDAVVAAQAASADWTHTAPDERGRMLYRVAELLEERRDQFTGALAAAEGWPTRRAAAIVDTALERWVWYAGWADKLVSVLGSVNPAPHSVLVVTVPEPAGVVAVLAPQSSALLGLVSVLAPVLATGNTAVLVASQYRPLPAVLLAEVVADVLASTHLPGAVLNVLTGRTAELAPWLAAHAHVAAIDLGGAPPAISAELERTAASANTRVLAPTLTEPDWTRPPDPRRLRALVELKTLWSPAGEAAETEATG